MDIKKFGTEYERLEKTLAGESFFIHGTNSTGKTTTFDAITYAIFGPDFIDRSVKIADTKIQLSNGETSFEIERGYNTEPKMRILNTGRKIKGSKQVNQKIFEFFNIPNTNYIKMIIDSFRVPQNDEKSLITRCPQKELEYVISFFLSCPETIEEKKKTEDNIQALNLKKEALFVRKKNLTRDLNDSNLKELRNKSHYTEVKEFIDQFESGRIDKTISALEENEDIAQKIKHLVSVKTRKSEELFRNGRELNDKKEYYNQELLDVIKQTLAVLVCPVCSKDVDIKKIVNRKNRHRCPFCGQDDYDGKLYELLEKEILESSTKVRELTERDEEIKCEIKRLNSEIEVLNNEKLHVKVNAVILRVLEKTKNKKSLKEEYEKYSLILKKYEEEFKKIRICKSETNDELNQIESEIKKTDEGIQKLKTYLCDVLEDKNKGIIDEFAKEFNDIYSRIIFPLPYKILLNRGSLLLDNGSSIKKCSVEEIGFSDKRLVDIALWATILRINKQKDLLKINFGLIDDIFENIDNNEIKRKDNLLTLLNDLNKDFQIIIFSINRQINEKLKLSQETTFNIQTKIHEFQRPVL